MRPGRVITGIAVSGALGAWLWCLIVLPNGTPETFPAGDGALIELYTLHVTRGWWAWGPYSRFGWHHPGPLGFYLLAPFYAASHFHHLALNAGALAINVFALATIAGSLVRSASTVLGVTIAAALGFYLWRVPPLIVSAWNPHIVLLPFAALIVTSAVVASGRLAVLPLAVAAASFVAQTHVGVLPSAAIAIGVALIAGVRQHARAAAAPGATGSGAGTRRTAWRWLAVSAVLAVILWLPAIVEQFTAADGNLGKLLRFFLQPSDAPTVSSLGALSIWTHAMAAAVQPHVQLPVGHGYPGTASVWMTSTTLGGVALLAVAGWWASRRERSVEAWGCWLCAALSIGAFVAIARITGGIADHLIAWIPIIALLGVASLVAVGVSWIADRLGPRRPVRTGWLIAAASLALIIATLVSGMRQLEAQREDAIRAGGESRTPVEAIYSGTRTFIARAHLQRPLIHPTKTAWSEAAGIILPLYKRQVSFAIERDSLWFFGERFAPDGSEDAVLTIADRSARPQVERRDGNCLLFERHGLSLHLLLPSLKTPTSVACE